MQQFVRLQCDNKSEWGTSLWAALDVLRRLPRQFMIAVSTVEPMTVFAGFPHGFAATRRTANGLVAAGRLFRRTTCADSFLVTTMRQLSLIPGRLFEPSSLKAAGMLFGALTAIAKELWFRQIAMEALAQAHLSVPIFASRGRRSGRQRFA